MKTAKVLFVAVKKETCAKLRSIFIYSWEDFLPPGSPGEIEVGPQPQLSSLVAPTVPTACGCGWHKLAPSPFQFSFSLLLWGLGAGDAFYYSMTMQHNRWWLSCWLPPWSISRINIDEVFTKLFYCVFYCLFKDSLIWCFTTVKETTFKGDITVNVKSFYFWTYLDHY